MNALQRKFFILNNQPHIIRGKTITLSLLLYRTSFKEYYCRKQVTNVLFVQFSTLYHSIRGGRAYIIGGIYNISPTEVIGFEPILKESKSFALPFGYTPESILIILLFRKHCYFISQLCLLLPGVSV